MDCNACDLKGSGMDVEWRNDAIGVRGGERSEMVIR